MKLLRVVLILALVLVAACSVRPRAVVKREPVAPPSRPQPAPPSRGTPANAREHVVARGDTLYGIAFRNSLDYRDLARWNGIAAPYTIYPGQRLRLTWPTAVAAATASRAPAPAAPRSTTTPAPATPAMPPPTSTAPAPAQPPAASVPAPTPNMPVTVPAPAPASTSVPPVSTVPATTPTAGNANTPIVGTGGSRTVQGIAWRWPASGQTISRFVTGEPTQQGIGIAGNAGQAVVAAADGEVVYSGSGLIGYGELIIVRHSDAFLSAYGHNRKRLVNEGQKVKAGQQIAEMGRSGASRDMLHFEIRRNGKPVDPVPFLPVR